MNIQQVIYAMEVYNFHSFTEAAKSLYISQPRLSQAIRELEDELGFEIFIRNKKGISGATVKGMDFIKQARLLLTQFSALESLKEDNRSSFHLSSTLITQAQDAYVTLCLEQMQDPNLDMELWFSSCFDSSNRIQSMASELGVVAMLDDQFHEWMEHFKSHNIEYHELSHSTIMVTVSKDSPLAAKEMITVEDLQDHTYIAEACSRINDLSAKMHSLLESKCSKAKVVVSNTYMMYAMVSDPESKSFVFEPYAPSQDTLEKFGLASIPFAGNLTAHLGYIKLADRRLTPLAERYLELLYKELEITYFTEESSL